MRTVPLIVLAHEGPSVRAYLARMRHAGLRPDRIVLMVQGRHPVTKKPLGWWLPRRARMWYAEKAQEHAHNYWPRRIRAKHPRLVEAMIREMQRVCHDAAGLIDEMLGEFRYERYAANVDRVLVRNLRDGALAEVLSGLAPGAVLYTGGGIVPRTILGIAGLRILHVHPGHLPEVRGADGLLWSTLVRGRPGMSCFYMNAGIDTGDIILARDYPPLCFNVPAGHRPDHRTLYRAIFSFCDPLLRAELLVDQVLGSPGDLGALPAVRQDPSEGNTYHFMHPALRQVALARLFRQSAPAVETASCLCRGGTRTACFCP